MSSIIYEPAEDSYLFKEFLEKTFKNKDCSNLSFLDMGTGSGILAKIAIKLNFGEVFAVDINKKALEEINENNINKIHSNLFSKIKRKFDIIVFNAPYLPRDNREPKESQLATTGGKRGDEISIRFLKKAKNHLNEKGKAYLLISSLTPLDKISKFKPQKVISKRIDFEELIILEFNEHSFEI